MQLSIKNRLLPFVYLFKAIEYTSLGILLFFSDITLFHFFVFITGLDFPISWINNPFFFYFYRSSLIIFAAFGIIFYLFYKEIKNNTISKKFHYLIAIFLIIFGIASLITGYISNISGIIYYYDFLSNTIAGIMILSLI